MTEDALKIIKKRYGDSPGFEEGLAAERLGLTVAMMIRDARNKADLTQNQLAERSRTTERIISQLEAAECDDIDLSLLQRIAEALDRRIEISMPLKERRMA